MLRDPDAVQPLDQEQSEEGIDMLGACRTTLRVRRASPDADSCDEWSKTMAGSIDIGAVAYSPDGNFIAQVEWSPDHTDQSVTIRKWQSREVVARVSYASVNLADHPWSPDGR